MTGPSLPGETVLLSTNSMYRYAFMVYFCRISKLSTDLQLLSTLSFLAVNISVTNIELSGLNFCFMESIY
jgi:hypothetical protein